MTSVPPSFTRHSIRAGRISLLCRPPVYNCFNLQRHLVSRRTLHTFRAQVRVDWQAAAVAA
jgi:hypothetical protein